MDRINFESNSEKRTLEEEFTYQKQRYFDLKPRAITLIDQEIEEYIYQIENEDMIGNIENFLQKSETDVDAQDNANSILKDFREILDHIEEILIRKQFRDDHSYDPWAGSRSATGFGSNNKWRDD